MNRFCTVGLVAVVTFSVEASQVQQESKIRSAHQYREIVNWTDYKVMELVGAGARTIDEPWIRILCPQMSQIEESRQQMLHNMRVQDYQVRIPVSYRLFNSDGTYVRGDDFTIYDEPLAHIEDFGENRILLLGFAGDDTVEWFVGREIYRRYENLRNTYRQILPQMSELFSVLFANWANGGVPLNLDAEQTAIFSRLPQEIRDNIVRTYKCHLSQGQQQVVRAESSAAAQNQQQAASQPRAEVLQNPIADNGATENLRHRGQSEHQQPVQPSIQSVQPQNQAVPVVARESWRSWSWKWSKRAACVGVIGGIAIYAAGPVTVLAGGKALALKCGLIKVAPIVAKAGWLKLGLLGL